MEMPEENGKKGTAPKLEFQMDYQNVKCIISEDFDDEFQAFLEEKENEDKPVQKVYCYTADEEARQMPFCVTAAADWTVGKKYYTNRQGIESYQCILTTGGCGYVETEGKVYTCSPGSLLLVDCYKPHLYRTAPSDYWEYKHIHFTAPGGQKVVDRCIGFLEYSGNAAYYFDSILNEFTKIDRDSCFIFSNLVSALLTEIIVLQSRQKKANSHSELLENAAVYLQEHYSENINISEFAKNRYISPYYFIRLFKESFGMSPYNYLVNFRITQAKELLVLTDHSVSEIAQEVGFGDASNFSTRFAKATGQSPLQYRKSALKPVEGAR